MHNAFESLKSYAEYKGWKWTPAMTMLALDVEEQWEEVDGILWHRQMHGFYEVFAALLFHNEVWHGFRLFDVPFKFWPIVVNGKPVSHYHVHRNRHQLLEVLL